MVIQGHLRSFTEKIGRKKYFEQFEEFDQTAGHFENLKFLTIFERFNPLNPTCNVLMPDGALCILEFISITSPIHRNWGKKFAHNFSIDSTIPYYMITYFIRGYRRNKMSGNYKIIGHIVNVRLILSNKLKLFEI